MDDSALWWIANAVLLLLVAPAVVVLAHGLLRQANKLNHLADDVQKHGVGIVKELEDLPKLARTRQLTSAARGLVAKYGGGLLRVLGA